MPRKLTLAALAAALVLLPALTAPASAAEKLFPHSGSDAYDVSNYRIKLKVLNRAERFSGRIVISATSRTDFSRVSLDAGSNLDIRSVQRNGRRVAFRHRNGKLSFPLAGRSGDRWQATILYRGRIRELFDWTGAPYGWVRSGRDGWVMLGEPNVARLWMPVNDTPADQASYRTSLNVPHGYVGASNGRLVDRTRGAGRWSFVWQLDGEIPPYSAVVTSGPWRLYHPKGRPIWNVARKPALLGGLKRVESYRSFLTSRLGDHPYGATGGMALEDMPYALETATRPVYWPRPGGALIVHELAHDWFGNSVSLADWQQIWLNEGPATWFEWSWEQAAGQRTIRSHIVKPWCRYRSQWNFPTAEPGPDDNIFSEINVYWRGGLVMELLRRKVGTDTFFQILRRWTTDYRWQSVDTSQFIALAEAEAGEDLSDLFAPYLYGTDPIWPTELMGFSHSCN